MAQRDDYASDSYASGDDVLSDLADHDSDHNAQSWRTPSVVDKEPLTTNTTSAASTPHQPTATEAAQMFVFSAAKAGMHDVDKEHVQKVVLEMSKDSKFFQNSIKQNEKVEARIREMRTKLQALTKARRDVLQRKIDRLLVSLETSRELTRTKVVIDMDMFYAAVEMRDNPSLRDKPLAVGGNSMLSTTNYVARKFGVRAAMPGFIGKELCPDLVMVPPNFPKYTAISTQIREIVARYDPQYRAMSLDEVYCDITEFMDANWTRYATSSAARMRPHDLMLGDRMSDEEEDDVGESDHHDEDGGLGGDFQRRTGVPPGQREAIAAAIVDEMRAEILEVTQLTASAGVAPNTMLAKICSDFNKPNGQYILAFNRESVLAFMETLPVRKIGGIGKVMEKTLAAALDITVAKQLYDQRVALFHLFSERTATWLLRISLGLRGNSDSEGHHERKGYSRERTFSAKGIHDPRWLEKICRELCDLLAKDLQEGMHGAKTVTLKLKCADFSLRTRAVTNARTLRTSDDFFNYAVELLRKELPLTLRLMGVRASSLMQLGSTDSADDSQPASTSRKRQAMIDSFTKTVAECEDVEASGGQVSVMLARKRSRGPKQLGMEAFTVGGVAPDFSTVTATSSFRGSAVNQAAGVEAESKPSAIHSRPGASHRDPVEGSFQPCPICQKMINVGNAIAIDLHVDACLRRGQSRGVGGSARDGDRKAPQRKVHHFFQR